MKLILNFEVRYGRVINLVLTVLSAVYLVDYSIVVLVQPTGTTIAVLNGFSNFIYAFFAIDLAFRILVYFATPRNDRSLRDFIVANFLPMLALLAPAFRTLRLFRLVLTLRGFVGLVRNRAESAGLLVLLAFPLIAYTSALAILDAERYAPGSNIHSFKDALWWSVITMTTVGYGDHYPVSDEGKLIAGSLLLGGIAIFSTITAIVSSWILTDRRGSE